MFYVDILLPLKLDRPFTYFIDNHEMPLIGTLVNVSFRGKVMTGVIWHVLKSPPEASILPKIKPILKIYQDVSFKSSFCQMIEWVARYTLSPLGLVLKLALSSSSFLEPPKAIIGYQLASSWPNIMMTSARKRVRDFLAKNAFPVILSDLEKQVDVSRSVLRKMIEEKALIEQEILIEETPCELDLSKEGHFSPEQKTAIKKLCQDVEAKDFSVTLLDGVTGSGKTEVYLEAVARTLQQNQQVLILLPEIALTPQTLRRFEKRFGALPHLWHSGLSQKDRCSTWQSVLKGTTPVVIGARSALFLPFKNLGLIVVDEEHEQSYKQEETVLYQGRDMAVVRGHIEKIPVILASATPSLESYVNTLEGRYDRVVLSERYGGATLPNLILLDRRQPTEKMKGVRWLSKSLIEALSKNLSRREQSLLYLNRRGYAPLTLCGDCGERLACPGCSAWLVEHRSKGKLLCHHCGFEKQRPAICPSCESKDSLVACGPGVERLEEEVQSLFPKSRILVLASDQGSFKDREEQLKKIEQGEIDIIIGTQMVAKGHHFPGLTLVGVVDADLGLSGGDLRASEKTYQLLHQVSGRAGRADQQGHVFLQTFMPDHPVLEALINGDRHAFLEAERQSRELFEMPPYGRLAGIIISGSGEDSVEKGSRHLARYLSKFPDITLLGPAPAPLGKIRSRFRWRILVKASKDYRLQPCLRKMVQNVSLPGNLRVQIDIDPYSFL